MKSEQQKELRRACDRLEGWVGQATFLMTEAARADLRRDLSVVLSAARQQGDQTSEPAT